MQSQTGTARPTFITHAPRGAFLRRVLAWLVERDRRHREACKLRDMPDERLADMGLTRRDAEDAFRR